MHARLAQVDHRYRCTSCSRRRLPRLLRCRCCNAWRQHTLASLRRTTRTAPASNLQARFEPGCPGRPPASAVCSPPTCSTARAGSNDRHHCKGGAARACPAPVRAPLLLVGAGWVARRAVQRGAAKQSNAQREPAVTAAAAASATAEGQQAPLPVLPCGSQACRGKHRRSCAPHAGSPRIQQTSQTIHRPCGQPPRSSTAAARRGGVEGAAAVRVGPAAGRGLVKAAERLPLAYGTLPLRSPTPTPPGGRQSGLGSGSRAAAPRRS